MNALAVGANETFASLRVRNFRLFFVGQGISQIGTWLTTLAQALLVLNITNSGLMVGLLAAFQYGPVLLIGPAAGLVADRVDKRTLLLAVQTVAMLQSFGLAAVAFSDSPQVWHLFVLAMVGGLCTALDNPARRSIVVELVDPDHLNNAVSLNSALMTGARVVGPAIAGVLISTVGYGWCFAIDGVSYLAVLAGFKMMDPSAMRSSPPAPKGPGQIRAGIAYVRSQPVLMTPLVMMAIVGTFAFNFQVVLPLLITQDFGQSESMFTWFFSVLSVGSFVTALAMARRATVTIDHLIWAATGFGVSMLALAIAPNMMVAFPIGVVLGVTSIGFMTSSTVLVQLTAAPEMRGRVLALQAMVFLGSTPIGGPILGAISEWFDPRVATAVGGVAALVAAAYGVRAADSIRRVDALHVPVDESPRDTRCMGPTAPQAATPH